MERTLRKAVIIGLGLIGGSIAKSLRRGYRDCYITAINRSSEGGQTALRENIINKFYNELSEDCLNNIEGSEIVFLCTELHSSKNIIDILMKNFENKETIITDVCSTKAEINDIFQNSKTKVNFIGGHPMAGSEKSGYRNSSEFLLENAVYILCPSENTDKKDIDFMKNIISSTGAIPYVMDAYTHDGVLSQISHLPHITASALVNTASSYGNAEILNSLAAGGFKDITRIASGDPGLWENIIMSNKNNVIDSIDELINNLNLFRNAIENSDKDELRSLLNKAKNSREAYETGRKTIMNLMYELNIDVPDKPGSIAGITAKLTENKINIKNIYIAESRENETGCMRLAFESKEARDAAASVLGVVLC